MTRMSEVFELPVSNNEVYISVSLIERSKGKTNIILEHAAHAINHVDALADSLEEALLQIEYLHKNLGETGSGNSVLSRGHSALNAYRGAK